MNARLEPHVERYREEIRHIRRHLHANPELSWEERGTTVLLAERLERAGLDPRILPQGTGLICDIGTGEGPVVALRADLDALPVQDAKDVAYRSQVRGVAHACGHDAHTAIVLGAGIALAAFGGEEGDFPDARVRLIFQPAEEVVPSGAPVVIASGALDDVRQIFALHCDPRLDLGQIGIRGGPITAAADMVNIRLTGPGGHTARPGQTVDLIGLAAKVVTDLTSGVSRLTDAEGGAGLTFGSFHAGTAPNVIPTEAELRGSLRVLDRVMWEEAPEIVAELLMDSVGEAGAEFELDYRPGAPPVVNDPELAALVAAVGVRLLGPDAVVGTGQSLGAEDFSWYLDHCRGAYARLGVNNPADPHPPRDLHDGRFDVDDRAIDIGVRLLANVAFEAAAALVGRPPA